MDPSDLIQLAYTVVFGPPKAIFFRQILAVLLQLCPCHPNAQSCMPMRLSAAAVITMVAYEEEDPLEAAGLLLGIGNHETGFNTELQEHGPAITFWQLEVPKEEREYYLTYRTEAAKRALRIAHMCHGNLVNYASGKCTAPKGKKGARIRKVAASLHGYVAKATSLLRRW